MAEERKERLKLVEKDSGTSVIAKILVPQMGSDHHTLEKGEIDRRVFAVLNEQEQVALGHFSYRAKVDKNRYLGEMVDWILASSPSIGGLGRRQTIDITAAATGGEVREFVKKPNVLARSLWNRSWREKAEQEGKTVIE